ncbi:MAG: DMT family transporter [Bacteroidales bacterium]|nr:DMT family transporter [Bacteroidales bacterium]
MWVYIALLSAFLLGFYDVSKKAALKDNAVMPVLWCHILICSAMMLVPLCLSRFSHCLDGTILHIGRGSLELHLKLLVKAVIVLGSWVCGYYGMKHLPITIYGPVNATRPILVLLGGLLFFREQLNLYQWIGVIIAIVSFYMLSRSSRKEGINFGSNKWVVFTVAATILGALSALYDKHLLGSYDVMFVQAWSNFYQLGLMSLLLLALWWPTKDKTTPFRWKWSIVLIALFLTLADFAYFTALSYAGSMISIVSMIRRSSVVVSFICGALLFKEKNLRSKAVDLALVLIGLLFLLLGSIK